MYGEMIEAMDTLKKERTGRRSGVYSVVSGRRAVLVAAIWTIRMTVTPVDILDALVSGGAFELVRRAFPLCILYCSAGHMRREHTHFYTYNDSCTYTYMYIYIFQSKKQCTPPNFSKRNVFNTIIVDFAFFSEQFVN